MIVTCVGDPAALEHVRVLLLEGPDRYPQQVTALALVGFDQVSERERLIAEADLLIVALDAGATLERRGGRGSRPSGGLAAAIADPGGLRRAVRRRGAVAGPSRPAPDDVPRAASRRRRGAARRGGPGRVAVRAPPVSRAAAAGPAAHVRAAPDGGGLAVQRGLHRGVGRAVAGADPRPPDLGCGHPRSDEEPGADGLPAGARLRGAAGVPEADDGDHPGDRRRRDVASGRRRSGRPDPRVRDPAEDRGGLRRHVHHRARGRAVVRDRLRLQGRPATIPR